MWSMSRGDQYLRYLSLVVLVIQNASQVLVLRYAAQRNQPQFIKTVAVLFNEVIKLIASLILLTITTGSVKWTVQSLKRQYFVKWLETLKVGVPALIYTIQNFLLYVAIDHLDAGTFMVTYQLKILTTALFTVLLLNRRLSLWQWMALAILTSADEGAKHVAKMVQLDSTRNLSIAKTIPETVDFAPTNQRPLIGLAAVLAAALMSGFAGVYFEKILKESDVSIWLRNVQLATFAIPIALVMIVSKDYATVQQNGWMHGFDWVVWLGTLLQSLGGLLIAVVVKYADNILKAFATSVAIIVSTVVSIFFFGIIPEPLFLLGATLVIGAVVVYSIFPYSTKTHTPTSNDIPVTQRLLDEKSDVSIWLRNVQLATFAIPIALVMIVSKDYATVQQNGWMHGFDWVVWLGTLLQSLGGLLIAVVVKYADNILKAFATSVAIIVSTVVSIFFFGIIPEPLFLLGATLVIGAVVVYSIFPYSTKTHTLTSNDTPETQTLLSNKERSRESRQIENC
ncbi:UDP-galactose/UDP-N-acetylglucosamine transporter srf-3 [Aphelenchoides besseyi]|nr:UDP-galactose/UDP-N-acetylglucosamine transporter srf-3 [Aphelenchoides besseyi]